MYNLFKDIKLPKHINTELNDIAKLIRFKDNGP